MRMRKALGGLLEDLTLADMYGLGPVLLVVLGTVNAVRADQPFDRWMWSALAIVMFAVCVFYVWWLMHRVPGRASDPERDEVEQIHQA